MTSGQAFSWPSAALPHIISGNAGFNLTDSEQSWMVTITFLGNLISPIPAGYVMDSIGRKNTMIIFDTLMIASWIIIYFSKVAWGLYVARFLAGLWAGIVYTVVPVLLGEVVAAKIRGTMGGIFGVMMYVGALYESLVGFGDYGLLTILSAIPPVILFLALCCLPESPYYYLMKGKREKAKRSIVWLRGKCLDEDLDKMEHAVQEQIAKRGNFNDIFKTSAARRAFFITQIFGIVQRAAGVTFLFAYLTIILPDSWVSAKQSFTVLCLVWIGSSFFASCIMDRFGRRTLMFISCVGSSLTMIGVSIWFYIYEKTSLDTSTTTWVPFILLIFNGFFYSLGIVSIPTLLQGELFPVNIKGKASALFCITVSIASGITVRIYQPLKEYVGDYPNFIICAVSCFIGAVFTATIMVETKGRTLEQIQDILEQGKTKKPPRSEIPT
uniref:Putative transporter major facilitator superfamily n=2 Tax=Rhodnius prolixus TaxID=13249 RepID=R4G3D5_RHOPR